MTQMGIGKTLLMISCGNSHFSGSLRNEQLRSPPKESHEEAPAALGLSSLALTPVMNPAVIPAPIPSGAWRGVPGASQGE